MALTDINTLKSWFQTLDKPTQAQFWHLMDSFHHKNDQIPQASIAGLVEAFNGLLSAAVFNNYEQGELIAYNTNAVYAIPPGYLLEAIIPFYGPGGTVMRLSKVAAGDEDIMSETPITEGWNAPIGVNVIAEAPTNLYIDGIPAGSKILFLKRKIKMAL